MLYTTTWIVAGVVLATSIWAFASTGNLNNNLIKNNSALEQQDNNKEVDSDNVNDENQAETKDEKVTLPTNAITEAKAKEIVAKSYVWNEIVWVETEDEDWKIVYNISLKDKTEVKVDALNWNILKADKEWLEWEKDDWKDDKSEENND